MDISKLRVKVCEKGLSIETLAEKIGMTKSTFYRKLSKGGASFTIGEIHKIVESIPLSKQEAVEIFLFE